MMFVSFGEQSYMRSDVLATATRNGDFISFCFEHEGIRKSILIPVTDIERCLDLTRHGDKTMVRINLDQAVTKETMIHEFNQRQRWLQALLIAASPSKKRVI